MPVNIELVREHEIERLGIVVQDFGSELVRRCRIHVGVMDEGPSIDHLGTRPHGPVRDRLEGLCDKQVIASVSFILVGPGVKIWVVAATAARLRMTARPPASVLYRFMGLTSRSGKRPFEFSDDVACG